MNIKLPILIYLYAFFYINILWKSVVMMRIGMNWLEWSSDWLWLQWVKFDVWMGK
jgi:hypothetical protein